MTYKVYRPVTGEMVRNARLSLGLTQEQLANLVEPPIARETLVKLENGKRNIGKVMLYRLQAAIGHERAEQNALERTGKRLP